VRENPAAHYSTMEGEDLIEGSLSHDLTLWAG